MTNENRGISTTNSSKFSTPRPENLEPSCVVLTYSVTEKLEDAIAALKTNGASVHYIIDTDGTQHQYHNDLTDRAFYAGESSWKGQESVNDFGIGIMFINNAESEFTKEQIAAAKTLFVDIARRYPGLDIETNLVGLGEVAERHIAPGKFFPWKDLAEEGFGMFPPKDNETIINTLKVNSDDVSQTDDEPIITEMLKNIIIKPNDVDEHKGYIKGEVPDPVTKIQMQLQKHGYGIKVTGECDDATVRWIEKFNTRYVPEQSPPSDWTDASQYAYLYLHGEMDCSGQNSSDESDNG